MTGVQTCALPILSRSRNSTIHCARVLSEQSIAEMEKNRLGPDVRIAYTPAETALGQVGYGFGEWIIGEAVSSPGLFGSLPWVDSQHGYSAFLLVFYLSDKGKQERYRDLMRLVNEAVW